jgi:diguanylate cyclase (GGDEF)-like protein
MTARTAIWAAVAALCLAAGTIASVLAAHSVTRDDSAQARKTFARTSTGIASTLKLAVQREEELTVSASTFFARNPTTSHAEFDGWTNWARTVHRFPELQSLGLITLVRTPELAAYEARLSGHPLTPAVKSPTKSAVKPTASATPAGRGFPIVPASSHHYYCLSVAELVRSHGNAAPAGLDYCALTPGLLLARDAGVSTFTQAAAGGAEALVVEVPVYRGNATPHTVFGRTAASVGWVREVLVPSILLAQVLRGHPENAVRLRYRSGSSNVTFTSGTAQHASQTAAASLHNGWSVRIFGAPAGESVIEDGNALAVLIGGILLSALLALLVFVLGSGRRRSRSPVTRKVPHEDLYDGLTGLPNRALTLDRAERMVARAGRQSGMLAGALFIDVDWFKDVNDKLGDAAGDQLLTIVAQRLEGVIRAGDTVGRFGGDEFVVLVESAARGVRLDSLARRIIESLHKPVDLDNFGPSFFATASIGVAFGRYETPQDLLRDAQLALYAAKAAGKDRYTLFNANMRSVIESRSVLEAELNTALVEKQFFLLYEPSYDLRTRKVVGLEALVRWRHPKRGIVEPEDFIPVAEDTGLIVPIGRWALEEACVRAAAWNVSGHRVGISVKVSANQLNRDGFATDVRRALQQSGLDPVLLTLEIAETTVMRDLSATAERLDEIKQLGVRIAIDDFGGSGYARHSDLQRLPLDVLKVDRSSLAASDDEDYRSWLLEAILIVGRDLSLTVVATGIESREQMISLQVMGCTTAQGPFMGSAVSGEGVDGLLAAGLQTPETSSTGPTETSSTGLTQ